MPSSLQRDFTLVLSLTLLVALGLAQVLRDLVPTTTTSHTFTPPENKTRHSPPLQAALSLFTTNAVPSPQPEQTSAFHTTYFVPPPKPPPPAAPTTKKVELTYLGFLQANTNSPKLALVQNADQQWTGSLGSNLVANVFIANILQTSLVVTNTEGQTNQLPFRTKTTLEVPIQ
jgi:hypothetical protein